MHLYAAPRRVIPQEGVRKFLFLRPHTHSLADFRCEPLRFARSFSNQLMQYMALIN